ncbi:MAG: dTDP-4-dehydrorhamnose 3,5-epimerase [Chlamydiia bacterium]|nr:dTDP-4-dehydrorhamnose 3,5-epimerase [Chlamydiia bacterium]
MKRIPTDLPDVILIEPTVFGDDRGYFLETYQKKHFEEQLGINAQFVQDNLSFSQKGVLRGLHYQLNHPQGKLVQVITGEVFDVAVDLRQSSPTFGKWAAFHLSQENKRLAYIPPGFAHGFLVLSDTAHFHYKCTDFYAPNDEHTLLYNDPTLNISWPQGISPLLSSKDRNGKLLKDAVLF